MDKDLFNFEEEDKEDEMEDPVDVRHFSFLCNN
jgi:hypothetical protein